MTLEEKLLNLMVQSQKGSHSSYILLLRSIEQISRTIVSRKLKQSEAVEDVIQEILISIDKAKHTYTPDRPFLPWMHALIEYRLADHWRKAMKLSEREVLDDDFILKLAGEAENANMESEFNAKVLEAIERLPEKQQQALLLTKRDGLSVKETAEQLSTSESATKVNVHRAIVTLRKILLGKP